MNASLAGLVDDAKDACEACPAGSYCLARSSEPIACAPGGFANVSGLAACFECDARYRLGVCFMWEVR